MNPKDLAHRLRQAREDCGMSQQAVADQLSLPRTAITQIEAGNRLISTFELINLAKLYRQPPAYFFEEEPENQDEVEVLLYRAEPFLQNIPEVKQHLELCHQGINLEKILGRHINMQPPTYALPIPHNKIDAARQGELIAEQERKRLGLGFMPIADIVDIINNQGIWISSTRLPDNMSGLFLNHPKTGLVILVNATHVIARKRFSFAHEYAHALLDRDNKIQISNKDNHKDLIEIRANAFAAAFLMPPEGMINILRNLNKGQPGRQGQVIFDVITGGKTSAENRINAKAQDITHQDVALIAHHFGASYQATTYRLRSLRHITEHECEQLIAKENNGKNYLRELNLYDDLEQKQDKKLWDRELRNQLIHLAIEAYRQEEISRGRIFELGDAIGIGGEKLYQLADMAIRDVKK
ncbi:MAG: ImmA/IrrE family metallo-endopeptidase [Legionellales bacterium]|jgi:Zn-dependent peptidase ImmA (M78 family)/DNA-binding XRE family transcriptional regulator